MDMFKIDDLMASVEFNVTFGGCLMLSYVALLGENIFGEGDSTARKIHVERC